MPPRLTRFELHIRPLMRLIDRDHMKPWFDLHSYQGVRDNADVILRRLRGDMPPVSNGGPWPPEWITLFERWIHEGFPKLELGEATYKAQRAGGLVIITAEGEFPSEDDNGWFERLAVSPREYIFYREPDPRGGSSPLPFEITEEFEDATADSVVICDANGRHTISIQ